MFFVPLLCTRSFVSVQSKPVETIIITHTKKVTLENIDNREPGPQFRLAFKNEDRTNPIPPPPPGFLIHLNLWTFAARREGTSWNDQVWSRCVKRCTKAFSIHTQDSLGCFDICSLKNGIVPDTKVKMSSLAATPVIAVPLRLQQTTADIHTWPDMEKPDGEEIWVIILLFHIRYIYWLMSPLE